MYSICKLENITGAALNLLEHSFAIDEIFTIEDSRRGYWMTSDDVIAHIVDEKIRVWSGSDLIIGISNQIDYLKNVQKFDVNLVSAQDDFKIHTSLLDEYRDRSGKLRVHQTSRKLGTMVLWTGEGDDPNIPDSVGGGEKLSLYYTIGSTEPLVKYIDFNCTSTESWIHEGYITWAGALLDTIDLKIVNRATDTVSGTGTNYNVYGDYLIIPAYPGTGTVQITSDITTSTGGLVYMPLNDLGVRTTAFWNATWNPSTCVFEDISAAPLGDGHYNMFSKEIDLSHIVRSMNLIESGFIALNSSDVDQIGHNMRLKFTTDINTSIRDHDLLVACTLCLHRSRSVNNSVFI